MNSQDEVERMRRKADAERAFWNTHEAELYHQYPKQFVAVHSGTVIAASPDLVELVGNVYALGVRPSDTWTRFLHDPTQIQIY